MDFRKRLTVLLGCGLAVAQAVAASRYGVVVVLPLLALLAILFVRRGIGPFTLLWVAGLWVYLWPDTMLPGASQAFAMRWGALAALVIFSLLSRSGEEDGLSIRQVSFPLAGVAWTLWVFASVVFSINPLLSFSKAGAWLLLFLLSFFGIPRLIRRVGISVFLLGLAIINVLITLGGLLYSLLPGSNAVVLVGFRGFVGNSNGTGLYILLTLTAVFFFFFAAPRWRLPLLPVIVLGLFLAGWASARGALGGTAVAAILLLVLLRPKALRSSIVFAGISTLLALFLIGIAAEFRSDPYGYKWNLSGLDPLTASRAAWWQVDLAYIQDRPLTGYGYGTVPGEAVSEQLAFWTGSVRERGSSVLAVLEETGAIGLSLLCLCFLEIFFHILPRLLGARRDFPEERAVATYALAALAVIAIVESFVSGWMIAPGSFPAFLLWTSLGALWTQADPWAFKSELRSTSRSPRPLLPEGATQV